MKTSKQPPVCDYEGSDYRTRFWQGQGREYEDQVERIALRRLMPPTGTTLLDVGAGFGRLADEYLGYEQVVLFDYSRSLLREARDKLNQTDSGKTRFIYVAGNWYQMPFVTGLFATMVQVRTLHHAADAPQLFAELARVARPGGTYVLEFANKLNLKAIARYHLRRQDWSPYDLAPVEFVALNYDFHPRWIRTELARAGFHPEQSRAVSHFRIGLLKRFVPTRVLVGLDRLLQPTGSWWPLTPSLFLQNSHPYLHEPAPPGLFFACPRCQTPLDSPPQPAATSQLPCRTCGAVWTADQGLYDFKSPFG